MLGKTQIYLKNDIKRHRSQSIYLKRGANLETKTKLSESIHVLTGKKTRLYNSNPKQGARHISRSRIISQSVYNPQPKVHNF